MIKLKILIILIGVAFILKVNSLVDFTNLKCTDVDRTIMYFDVCFLKSVNRSYKYITIHAKFPRRQPTNDIKVNFALLRKENGYKPFLYNITVDACKYLKTRSNPVIRYAHTFFEKYSTVNRSCPYGDRDEMLEKLPVSHINHLVTDVLPMPQGDYAYVLTFYLFKKKATIVTVFATLK